MACFPRQPGKGKTSLDLNAARDDDGVRGMAVASAGPYACRHCFRAVGRH